MADTRCSNPKYQLDVDTLIIEYIVYYAIYAKLKELKAWLSDNTPCKQTLSQNADQMIENFDMLIRLFHRNHPEATISQGTTYNIKILEFLVLFSQWLDNAPCSERLYQARNTNAHFRKEWLKAWTNDAQTSASNIKSYINIDQIQVIEPATPIELNDLINRFMDLSAEVSYSMGLVNEQWYQLAAEFTFQCTLERLNIIAEQSSFNDLNIAHARPTASWLCQCLAWGVVSPCPFEQLTAQPSAESVHEQIFIRDMFRSHPIDTDSETLVENPTWTRLRTKNMTRVIEIIQATENPHIRPSEIQDRFDELRSQYPLADFLRRLREFVDGLWCLNMDNISGKPVLVQIEEGGMVGLDEDEFRGFLERVGLKDAKGKGVRWAR